MERQPLNARSSAGEPEAPSATHPTRRDLLAGAAGGAIALAADFGLDALTSNSATEDGTPNAPYLIGKSTRDLPSGLVRADVRAFKNGSGTDYHQAFMDAFAAADAVYVPSGTLFVSQGISVPAGKVVYSDGALDQTQASHAGTIVRLTGDIGSQPFLSLGRSCEIRGLTVDANGNAEVALEIPKGSDECRVWNVKAANGKTAAFSGDASRLTILGCLFIALEGSGRFAYQCSGADFHVIAVRMIGGTDATALIDGFYGDYEMVHFQGSNDTQNDGRVTGNHNHFVQCRFDGGTGPNLLVQARGNEFISCRFYNGRPGQAPSAIRIDGTSTDATQNQIADVFVDGVKGRTWKYLLEILGPVGTTRGTILGSGSCSFCDSPFNVRPASVGILTNAELASRSEFQATLSGDGRTASFRIPHGLLGTPITAIAQPASADAAASSSFVSELGPTDLVISFATAPPSGKENLAFHVIAAM